MTIPSLRFPSPRTAGALISTGLTLLLSSCASTVTNTVPLDDLNGGGTYFPVRDFAAFYLQPNSSAFDIPYRELSFREPLVLRAFNDREARVELADGTLGYVDVTVLGSKAERPSAEKKEKKEAPETRAKKETPKKSTKITPTKKRDSKPTSSKPNPPKRSAEPSKPAPRALPDPPKVDRPAPRSIVPTPPTVPDPPAPVPTRKPGLDEGSVDDLVIQPLGR